MRNFCIRIYISIFLFVLVLPVVFAMELSQGRIRLVLHQDSGRFSLFYRENMQLDEYTPMLFSRDPRTSSLGLLHNNRMVVLGEASGYRQEVRRRAEGGEYVWTSQLLRITQRFTFFRSSATSLVDAVSITVSVENLSRQPQAVGIHLLLDTYLGESGGVHFITDQGDRINEETGFRVNLPQYWVSPASLTPLKGLQGMIRGEGLSTPDRIIFANWKRLNDNTWNFGPQRNRNFNLLPYSINDSAVAYFFEPDSIAPETKREITIALGGYSGRPLQPGVPAEPDEQELASLIDRTIGEELPAAGADRIMLLRRDLSAIQDLNQTINSLLEFPDEITDNKINALKQIIESLKERKYFYDGER